VRAIFELYLQHQALLPVVRELERRRWTNKRWTTRKDLERGGKPFTKTSLHKLLTNVAYLGKVRYKTEVHDGEHQGIVDAAVWHRVQATLGRNGRSGGAVVRNKHGALLKGLLRCAACNCSMCPSHTTKGNKRYRYYVCSNAQKRGWQTCPSKSVPAAEIERLVVDQIKCIGRDPVVLRETLAAARAQASAGIAELEAERRGLERDLGRWNADVAKLAAEAGHNGNAARLADLHERIRDGERRTTEINEQVIALGRQVVDEREVAQALSAFEPVWASLTPREQGRIVQLLVERVDYDGGAGKVSIRFHPAGIKTLAGEFVEQQREKIA
jgi:site-specific DNA recombinase